MAPLDARYIIVSWHERGKDIATALPQHMGGNGDGW